MSTISRITRLFLAISVAVMAFVLSLTAQTNPAPQTLPVAQNFGTTTFTSLPAGFVVWNGISGAAINTQALAEASVPLTNATITAAMVIQASAVHTVTLQAGMRRSISTRVAMQPTESISWHSRLIQWTS